MRCTPARSGEVRSPPGRCLDPSAYRAAVDVPLSGVDATYAAAAVKKG